MKRFATATALTLLVSSLPAYATGIGLRWNSCQGTSNRSFACDRTTGSEILVASFSPPGGISEMTGIEATLHITTADGNIPAWWQMFNVGSCRRNSLQVQLDVSDQMDCDDPWEGQAMGGIARYRLEGSTGVDLLIGAAVPSSLKRSLSSGRTYAAFKLAINHLSSLKGGLTSATNAPPVATVSPARVNRRSGARSRHPGRRVSARRP